MRYIIMVYSDTSDGPLDDNWSDDVDTTFTLIDILPGPITAKEYYLKADPPHKIHCDVCNKERIETRCLIHLAAKGCHYCHLQTNIHMPGKEGAGI